MFSGIFGVIEECVVAESNMNVVKAELRHKYFGRNVIDRFNTEMDNTSIEIWNEE